MNKEAINECGNEAALYQMRVERNEHGEQRREPRAHFIEGFQAGYEYGRKVRETIGARTTGRVQDLSSRGNER